MQNGKGSKPRPIKDLNQYRENFDSIDWGKKNENTTCVSFSDEVISSHHETQNSPSDPSERETS